jgi:hypothetical protein
LKEDVLRKVANKMKEAGYRDLTKVFEYLDDDNSGVLDRAELDEGLKRMKVTLSVSLIKNLFIVLDKNSDNKISLKEFEKVLSKFFSTGGPVKELSLADVGGDKKLLHEMKEERKEVIEYDDVTLEPMSLDEVKEANEKLVSRIQSGDIEKIAAGGELVLKLFQAKNVAEVNGKPKYLFRI